MTSKSVLSTSTSTDLTGIGQRMFREKVRDTLHDIEGGLPEAADFWKSFLTADAHTGSQATLVLTDLWPLVRRFERKDVHEWTASVRRTRPYFVAFVRTARDQACAAMIDDVVRASDMRLNVCNDASDWALVAECLSAGLSSVRPDGVVEARYLSAVDALWVQFGDGWTGILTWQALELEDLRDSLVPESATVSSTHTAIEIATVAGDLFEIDSAAARALLDADFSDRLRESAQESDEALGAHVRRARLTAGLTQPTLGERTGLDQAVISRIERGRVRPRIDTIRRLAAGLDLTVSELLSA